MHVCWCVHTRVAWCGHAQLFWLPHRNWRPSSVSPQVPSWGPGSAPQIGTWGPLREEGAGLLGSPGVQGMGCLSSSPRGQVCGCGGTCHPGPTAWCPGPSLPGLVPVVWGPGLLGMGGTHWLPPPCSIGFGALDPFAQAPGGVTGMCSQPERQASPAPAAGQAAAHSWPVIRGHRRRSDAVGWQPCSPSLSPPPSPRPAWWVGTL